MQTSDAARMSFLEWKPAQIASDRCWCGSCWQSYIWTIARPLAAIKEAEVVARAAA